MAVLAGALASLLLAAAKKTEGPACPPQGARAVHSVKILDGTTFSSNAGEVRLAGIAAADKNDLTRVLSGKSVTFAGDIKDRYARVQAQVFVDGVWVQEALLRNGMALANPDAASIPCAPALLEAEDEARSANRGRWRDDFHVLGESSMRLRARALVGTFQIFQGRVKDAAIVGGRGFLNFGDDRRTDTTVTIAPADMKNFRKAKLDIRKLKDAHVRIRGWVEMYQGPNMTIAHPEAIEVLERPAGAFVPAKTQTARKTPGRRAKQNRD